MKRFQSILVLIAICFCVAAVAQSPNSAKAPRQASKGVPPVCHSKIGDRVQSADGDITLMVVGRKLNMGKSASELNDSDIYSPKSVHFHPNGNKYYINSLEGCRTMVYDAHTNKKLAVIHHRFNAANSHLWAKESGLFPFKHYHSNLNTFWGRPVESAFSHRGRYLWIPYYRRSFDINAQDPSAIAVIDTRVDTIVKVFETGPLPKMVAATANGKYLAVTHWGDNTVGILDIASANPDDWHYVKCVAVDHQLTLNFSLTQKVDRDSNSGYLLRGTVFTPDDRYMLVACMGGGGGIAVIDMQKLAYVGRLTGVHNARHLVVKNGYLYASLNAAGIVQRLPIAKVVEAIKAMKGKAQPISGWEACKVGGGARTISLSPSGNYAFAACNSASQLCVVDTRTMKQVAAITIDSYPVGLDISADGKYVVLTSQGRKGFGGNAVNLVEVTYKDPEPTNALIDEQKEEQAAIKAKAQERAAQSEAKPNWQIIGIVIGFGVIFAIFVTFRKKRK